jgi:hypothetical protein
LNWAGCSKSIPFNRNALIVEVDKHLSDRCRHLGRLRSRSDSDKGNQDAKGQTDNNASHKISPFGFGAFLILDFSLLTTLNKLPPALSFSTKNIRCQLHGDPELTIARLHPHHARLALEGLALKTEGEPDGVSDRVRTLGLKENPRGADITRGAGPIVQLHG